MPSCLATEENGLDPVRILWYDLGQCSQVVQETDRRLLGRKVL